MAEHNPGPWYVDGEANDTIRSSIIRDANGFNVANTRSWIKAQHEANAKLIAAAPELLTALHDAVRLIEHLGGNAGCQRKAIEKATPLTHKG